MNVLVVSGTGLLGMDICKKLKAKRHQPRALMRAGSPKEGELKQLGIETVVGDLKDPASLEAVCKGTNAIIGSATAILSKGAQNSLQKVDELGYRSLLAAAKKAGVMRFIYISASPNLDAEVAPLVAHKRAIEAEVRASGLTWTILQPSSFMEVWLGPALGWKIKEGKAQVFGPGTAPISYISLEDVAAWAVAVLDEPKAANQDIALGGPRALSPGEAVKIFEQALGKPLKVARVPGVIPRIASAVLKPLNPKLASLMGISSASLKGDAIDMSKARSIAKVQETTVEEFVKRQVS